MHIACEKERRHDTIYCMLTLEHDKTRDKLVQGIRKLVLSQTQHPAVHKMMNAGNVTIDRAMLLAAAYIEPDFLRYLMEQPGVCTSTMSEYAANVLPSLVEEVLDGNLSVTEFVHRATQAYVRL